jgi:hypothetical protein
MTPLGVNYKCYKGFTMSAKLTVQPIDEQNYLKHNALLCLVLGVLFSFSFFYIIFEQGISSMPILENSLLFIGAVISISMMVICIKTIKSANKVKNDTFYYGNFKDEYLNHINLKGYKYVFNFVCFYFFTIFICMGPTISEAIDFLPLISIRDFCLLTMGLIFISYALPVLYMLNGTDDE